MDNESIDNESLTDCREHELCRDLGLAHRRAWIAHILYRQKGNVWTKNILSLLEISSRVVALYAAWRAHWGGRKAAEHDV